MKAAHVDELKLAEVVGVWAIRSSGPTIYFVDADSLLLLRRLGLGSTPGFADDRWVPLVSVEAVRGRDSGIIRVGDRHKYTYDFEPDGQQYGYWIQRPVTSIDIVDADELAALPAVPQAGPL